jgi:enoyl-CoA hydratase/carnithine racemase
MSETELVGVEIVDHVGWLTLDDLPRRNSVTAAMSNQLAQRCAQLADDPQVHAVVLTSSGPTFSSGGDVTSLTTRRDPLHVSYRGFDALAALTVPTLAAVNGPAVGAGVNFALACDVIVAGESARFDPRFLDIGIHPGGGHLWRLTQRAGAQAAAALVLFGESLSGRQAAEVGLAWSCVPDDELLATVGRMAARAAGRSAELVRRTKASLRASGPITVARQAADLELTAQQWSMTRPAFIEGVRALQERLAAKG